MPCVVISIITFEELSACESVQVKHRYINGMGMTIDDPLSHAGSDSWRYLESGATETALQEKSIRSRRSENGFLIWSNAVESSNT